MRPAEDRSPIGSELTDTNGNTHEQSPPDTQTWQASDPATGQQDNLKGHHPISKTGTVRWVTGKYTD